jgi:hypothetical protein
MEKKRVKREVYLADDEDIIIVKKSKPSLLKKMLEDKIQKMLDLFVKFVF